MVEPDWAFCGDCGAPATQAKAKAIPDDAPVAPPGATDCPSCGATVEPSAAYCGACGADLLGPSTDQSRLAAVASDAGRAPAVAPPAPTGQSQRRRWPAVMALVLAGLAVAATALVVTRGVPWSDTADQTTDDDALAAEVTEPTGTPTTVPDPTPASPSATPQATPDTAPTPSPDGPPTPVAIPAGFTSCGTGTDGVRVFGNEVTSCPFALNVADAWTQAPDSLVLFEVPSPVTGQTYDMRCSGTEPVRCTGGNNAAVLIYP